MEQPQNAVVRKRICRALAVCWMVVIFAFSARNADLSTQDSMSIGILFGRLVVPSFAEMDAQMQVSFADLVDHPIRKLAHATEYAVLGFLLTGSYADRSKKRLLDELHQLFVPGRSCELTDMLIDSSGVVAGTLAGLFLFMYWKGRKERKRSGVRKGSG